MNSKPKKYDLIVVYSGGIAYSASNKKYKEKFPFSSKTKRKGYNDSYSYFLSKCKKLGIRVAFTTSKDIVGSGLFRSCWTYNQKWTRNKHKVYSQVIFDRFTPSTIGEKNKLKLLTSSKSIYLFGNQKMKNIFQDKLITYNHFKKFAIPTLELESPSKKNIILTKSKLDKLLKIHNLSEDFSDSYIIKDKTGAGGFKIYKMDLKESDLNKVIKYYHIDKKKKKLLSYIIQPFVNCNEGFVFGNNKGFIDLRVIILNNKIIQTYIRVAKKGKFECNEHQGGNLIYMPLKLIPNSVITMTKKIVRKLNSKLNLKHSIYALDFIRSNNGNLYFIEGNNNPGIDWNSKKRINEIKSKELIDIIVKELKSIVKEKN